MKRRVFLSGLSAAAFNFPARADWVDDATAIAGDRFMIGAQEFHLTDIIAPSAYDLGRPSEPFFEEAKLQLTKLLGNTSLKITEVDSPNRWGAKRVSVQIAGHNKTLQEQLVEMGCARVAPHTDDLSFIERLLKVEKAARAQQRGLWALDAYRIVDATNARRATGAYNIIEGQVRSARLGRGRYYLNFGEDFRKDFTVTTASRTGRAWAKDGFDLLSLEGALIRVRGFTVWINGPSIELSHIKQIELL